MAVEYKCYYVFGTIRKVTANTASKIINFEKGFWADAAFNFAETEEDRKWWIPFHHIEALERVVT